MKALWALEEKFWTADTEFYRSNLADDCLMLFPRPVGALTRDQVVESIAKAPRWSSVAIEERRVLKLTSTVRVLVYSARARREANVAEYSALVASVYVKRQGAWRLAFHQQTPGAR